MTRFSSQSPRIGAVSYLNTKPLVYTLAERLPGASIEYDLPSRLADRLAAGQLDVALIPSFEYFRHPGYSIVSDACIGCRGAVWSVKLLCRCPAREIRSLALDEGSRTSAALVRILLHLRFGIAPQLTNFPIGSDAESMTSDAVLLIGDRAMHVREDAFTEVWDLGLEWQRQYQLPFVFAMWVARPGLNAEALAEPLAAARDAGLANLARIASASAEGAGLTEEATLCYLRDHLHFVLGPEERESIELFSELSALVAGETKMVATAKA